jgi:hypothetical protein
MSYILLNPHLPGKELNSKEKTAGTAAEDIWGKLSTNIKNYSPNFYFSIQDTKSNKLFHYKVNENLENDRVKYTIQKFKGKVDEDGLLNGVAQAGGKRRHHDDSSSSSSSEDGDYLYFPSGKSRLNNKGWTITYYPTIYGVPNVILPTFSSVLAPVGVSIQVPSYNGTSFVWMP